MAAPPRRDPEPAPLPPSPLPPPPPPAPGKQREEKKTALSKVVIRRLPPCLTKEQLEEQLHPLPAHDYFEFCTADPRTAIDIRIWGVSSCRKDKQLATVVNTKFHFSLHVVKFGALRSLAVHSSAASMSGSS